MENEICVDKFLGLLACTAKTAKLTKLMFSPTKVSGYTVFYTIIDREIFNIKRFFDALSNVENLTC